MNVRHQSRDEREILYGPLRMVTSGSTTVNFMSVMGVMGKFRELLLKLIKVKLINSTRCLRMCCIQLLMCNCLYINKDALARAFFENLNFLKTLMEILVNHFLGRGTRKLASSSRAPTRAGGRLQRQGGDMSECHHP